MKSIAKEGEITEVDVANANALWGHFTKKSESLATQLTFALQICQSQPETGDAAKSLRATIKALKKSAAQMKCINFTHPDQQVGK